MAKRTDVFLSSTSYDLPEHRRAVLDVLNTMKLQPLGMEYWAVTGEDPVDLCRRHVEDAEIFIGIYAYRYGWCPDGHGGKSITEMEYDWAEHVTRDGKPIPRLCFIMHDDHDIKKNMVETDKQNELNAFKARVKAKHAGFFKSVDDLKSQVSLALHELLKDQIFITPKPTCNMADKPRSFAGRTEEIEQLLKALSGDGASVALKGMGGMGKTTLAQELAHKQAFGMVLWADLAETWDEALELRNLNKWGKMLTGREYPPGTPSKAIAADLRVRLTEASHNGCGEPVLVVIDNVWNETIGLARLLREAAPASAHVLVTTRSEDVAASLDCASVALNQLKPEEGAAMIRGLLNPHDHERAPEADLHALSEALGGHPLSLNLAARQLRRNFQPRKVAEMAARMRKGLDAGDDFATLKLDEGETKIDSVAVALRQTLDTLSEERQAQFHMLGVLPVEIPFRGAHVLALWVTDDTVALDDLVAEGLIEPVPGKDDQYTQHRLLRAYALALLRKMDDVINEVELRHWNYLVQLAGNVFVERQDQPETWGELTDDLPQLHALGNTLVTRLAASDDPAVQDEKLSTLAENGAPSAAKALLQACSAFADAISNYIIYRYVGEEGRRWLWAGLAAARTLDHERRTGLFSNTLGLWHDNRGQPQAALPYYQQAMEVDIRYEDKFNQATILNNLGSVYDTLGQYDRALDYFLQSLSLYIVIGDKLGQATALNNLGSIYDTLGQHDRALEYYQQALPLCIEVGNKSGQAATLNNLGLVYARLGQYNRALEYYQQALPLCIEVGNKSGQASTLNSLGEVYDTLGQYERALDYFQQALPLCIEFGDKGGQATTLNNLGAVYLSLNQTDRALEYYQQALPLRIEFSNKGGQALTLNSLGGVYRQLGQTDRALEYYQQALPLCVEVENHYGEAVTRANIALSLWDIGQRGEALTYMQQARDINASIGISTADEDKNLAFMRQELGLEPPDA